MVRDSFLCIRIYPVVSTKYELPIAWVIWTRIDVIMFHFISFLQFNVVAHANHLWTICGWTIAERNWPVVSQTLPNIYKQLSEVFKYFLEQTFCRMYIYVFIFIVRQLLLVREHSVNWVFLSENRPCWKVGVPDGCGVRKRERIRLSVEVISEEETWWGVESGGIGLSWDQCTRLSDHRWKSSLVHMTIPQCTVAVIPLSASKIPNISRECWTVPVVFPSYAFLKREYITVYTLEEREGRRRAGCRRVSESNQRISDPMKNQD